MIGHDQVEFAGVTDVGVRRSHNQDSHAVLLATDAEQWRERGHVFLVADGMGAHAVGELASEQAASIIPHTYYKYAPDGADVALRKAFQEANSSIHNRGQQNNEFRGMGTTSTALVLRGDKAWVAHVGDSRAYRVRDGRIEQLSFDHSLVWEMARRQGVNPEDLREVPSNVIVRSLGPDALVQVDVEGPHVLRPGDIYVLCSDGLSGQLTDLEIGAVASVLPPAEACRFLVSLANLRGGPDNITAIVVRVGGESLAPDPPAPEVPRRAPWFVRVGRPLAALLARPLAALVVGTVLAAEAALLAALRAPTGTAAFALAVALILLGLCGLAFHHVRERRLAAPAEAPEPELHVYRSTACAVDATLVERMAKAAAMLKHWAEDKQWEPDWGEYFRHHEKAEACLGAGDFAAAFREHCLAVRPFTDALQRHRSKEESFQPVWERA